MQNVTLICVGKLKERFYADACAEYQKRLSRFCKLTVVELAEERLGDKPSQAQIEAALAKEADAVRAHLPQGACLAALCVEGKECSSEDFSGMLEQWGCAGKHPVFLIGSSCGLHSSLKAAAHARISMSAMTFPHHLARVMLLEQIYRAYQIQAGTKYNK